MFNKILIANRGEIACRVIQTAHRLGIRCVAVYSEADRHARHVAMADEAFLIGPAASSESYLRADKIIEVAKTSGAQAIHPGYGFLAENADFAEMSEAHEVTFIGPTADMMRKLGDKARARDMMSAAGVPIIPGSEGTIADAAEGARVAESLGYPVMIKASAGGGGKGLRVAANDLALQAAVQQARTEAEAAFGASFVDQLFYLYLKGDPELEQATWDTYTPAFVATEQALVFAATVGLLFIALFFLLSVLVRQFFRAAPGR